jgi:type VI secretion system secreted protein VgrG
MKTYTQDDQPIQLITPLGKDELLLQRFSGTEAISRLFHFELWCYSENHSIPFDALVGQPATIKVALPDGTERYISGVVNTFTQGGTSALSDSTNAFATYRLTFVPWLWLLTRTTNCRIFQEKDVRRIIREVFEKHKFRDFQMRLHGAFEKREYCVQYCESDFNFVSRLMEEEGIFYFFEHAEGKHTLVLANHPGEFKQCGHQPTARYNLDEGSLLGEDIITEWTVSQEVRPGKYKSKDFNFEQPTRPLTASAAGRDARQFEVYEYPGDYMNSRHGEQLARIRMQEQEVSLIRVNGTSTCRGFSSGTKFDLKDHYRPDLNKSYVLTSVTHAADVGTSYRSSRGAGQGASYGNELECIPDTTHFRPPRLTPAPLVHGSQTAIVVGVKGDEITTDNYGRVKVKFHWDRDAGADEGSSCWIRVSQPWAGKGWGTVAIPRIGQEVIVDFLEGDPDRPIITGRVYNADQTPPFDLPAGQHIMGFRSDSTKGGGGYNEITIHDGKSDEKIVIFAQKNMNTTVGHDDEQTVVNDRTIKVNGKQAETVKNDMSTTVTSGNQSNSVEAGYHHSEAQGEVVIKSKGDQVYIEASTQITLKVGASSLRMNQSGVIELSGTDIKIVSTGPVSSEAGTDNVVRGAMVLINT